MSAIAVAIFAIGYVMHRQTADREKIMQLIDDRDKRRAELQDDLKKGEPETLDQSSVSAPTNLKALGKINEEPMMTTRSNTAREFPSYREIATFEKVAVVQSPGEL